MIEQECVSMALLCVVDGIDPLRSQLLSLSKGKELSLTIHHQPKCVGELKNQQIRSEIT